MLNRILLAVTLFVAPFVAFCQEENEEDEKKMVREVISVQVERSRFAAPTPPPVTDPKSKKKKKRTEEPPPEVAPDTGNPMMPAPISEIVKRAHNYAKAKHPKYKKLNASTAGENTTCQASFVFKQKMLNPENDVDGHITMDVVIEAKDGKYRYTIKNIRHKGNKASMSGGDIYSPIPEAGSMKITDQTWKQIKSAAYGNIQTVVDDIKAVMKEDGEKKKKDEW